MPDSDDDYVQDSSDEHEHLQSHGRSGGRREDGGKRGGGSKRAAGFEVSRTWETLEEGADGTITGAIEGLLEAGKRNR